MGSRVRFGVPGLRFKVWGVGRGICWCLNVVSPRIPSMRGEKA